MRWEVKMAIFITIMALVVVLAYVIISPYSENGQFDLRRGFFLILLRVIPCLRLVYPPQLQH